MLDHVGDRLLDDPVGSQVQPGGKLGPLAADVQVHSDASFGGSLDQAAQVRQSRRWYQRAVLPPWPCVVALGPQHPKQPPHLAQRTPADLLDGRQRPGCLLRARADHVVGDPRLHSDQAHRVCDDVVQLARDLQPLLAARPASLGQLLTRPPLRLLGQAGRIRALLPHRIADRPRSRDQQPAP
jgi:hypothetical protein